MWSPRAAAASRKAGATITQAALDDTNCCRYFAWLIKLSSLAPADSSGAKAVMSRCGSPWSSPPSASTTEPRRSTTPCSTNLLGRVHGFEHAVSDVVLGVDVDRILQDHIVLFRLCHLIDNLGGALGHLRQLFALARGQVFLELASLALKFAVLIHQLFLPRNALRLRQCGCLALELITCGLEASAQIIEILFALGELLLQLGPGRLGDRGLFHEPVYIDETEAKLLRLRDQTDNSEETSQQALTYKMLH